MSITLLGQDYQLYNHFSSLFDRRVEQLGQARMAEEVERLESATTELQQRCGVKAADSKAVPAIHGRLSIM